MSQQSQKQTPANRLAHETSPYLQQHAHNPVDWFPWNEEALAKAREENKPILLSIGYSACHWCHVMAHESFGDADTAQVMNELFVNIKVDREERPDLDKIYQFAHQLLAQRGGGWPLTMFLMPEDQTPFFGGTYFPKQQRYGMPAFVDVIRQVEKFYRERPDDLDQQNASVRDYLLRASEGVSGQGEQLDATPLDDARLQLAKSFDGSNGGFGGAPKFPHVSNLERLLRHWRATGGEDKDALLMVKNTLHAMAFGGIYDQLGGGFCRYSVDAEWEIPHFEKMLYDNGPLLAIYADAWAATGDAVFRRIAEETGEWVMREMQSSSGGYYSTLDADSEGEEGKFYAWTLAEVKQVLDGEEYDVASRVFGLDQTPNFEGKWHLKVNADVADVAKELTIPPESAQERLSSAKAKLFAKRDERIYPGRDEKILTSWNGLMIKGMAVAGRRLGREDFIASAERALDFVRDTLWQDGRLLATCKDGKAHLAAYLDDYVFMAEAILALLEVRWRAEDMALVRALMEAVLSHFSAEDGGFYFTADDHEQLIQRPRPWADEATPSGNGVAALVFLRLGHLLGETRYLDAAESCLQRAWPEMNHMPHVHNTLLHALEELLYPTEVVVLRGESESMQEWLASLAKDYAPRRVVLPLPKGVEGLPEGLVGYGEPEAGVLAYVCRAGECLAPVAELGDLRELLG